LLCTKKDEKTVVCAGDERIFVSQDVGNECVHQAVEYFEDIKDVVDVELFKPGARLMHGRRGARRTKKRNCPL
jgi:hypothetical protein